MIPPKDYPQMFGNNACKLKKSLYGIKQVPRQWNKKLKEVLIEFDFVQSLHNYSLFTLSKSNVFFTLLLYVDDIIITFNDALMISKMKMVLNDRYKIKNHDILYDRTCMRVDEVLHLKRTQDVAYNL